MTHQKMVLSRSHPFVRAQISNNQETRQAWGHFGAHRQRVMSLIQSARRAGDESVAILGAGNCNDLDLPWLVGTFRTVHLFDLDAEALADGIAGQRINLRQSILLHAPIDITGSLHLLAAYLERPPTEAEFEALRKTLWITPTPLHGVTTDVVVSDCILSQIISSLTQLRLSPEQLIALTLAMRTQHLRTLVASLNPGGRAVFVSDLVSSDTLPELPRLEEAEWLPALRGCLQAGNFFTGLNPEMVAQTLKSDPYFRQRVVSQRFIAPWRWDISASRAYLVYACIIGVAS